MRKYLQASGMLKVLLTRCTSMKYDMLSAADGFQNERFLPFPDDSVATADSVSIVGNKISAHDILVPTVTMENTMISYKPLQYVCYCYQQ